MVTTASVHESVASSWWVAPMGSRGVASPKSSMVCQVLGNDLSGHGVLMGVASGADGGDGSFFGQSLGVSDRQVLPGFKGSS